MNYNRTVFIIVLFALLLISAVSACLVSPVEGLEQMECPDVLVREQGNLVLYSSGTPGQPINKFSNMDEYITYAKENPECPVVFLQQETSAQGKLVYRARPSPFDMQPGLPESVPLSQSKPVIDVIDATRDRAPYNQTTYAGFDAHGQHVGEVTKVDVIHESTELGTLSRNPMDTNWGGVTYTQSAVESGAYADREVKKPRLYQPRGEFNKGVFTAHGGPADVY